MKRASSIRITGIVQGVGFRPFVYNLAVRHSITGFVLNDTEGVLVEAEGDGDDLERFIEALSAEAPPLSYIHSITSRGQSPRGYGSFTIEKSRATAGKEAFYSPDVAVCERCLGEFFDPGDRRYGYPFITCINCGPRFSIIRDVPYDRDNTSMDAFPMCENCRREYGDSDDRRFHTQPNACPICGPHYGLYDRTGTAVLEGEGVAARIVAELRQGRIVAIKGIGGYLIALDAANGEAVAELRRRKKRPFKPFALMAGSLEVIRKCAEVTDEERRLLVSKERPIVLLKMRGQGMRQDDVGDGTRQYGMHRGQSMMKMHTINENDGKSERCRGQSPQNHMEGGISPLVAPWLSYLGFMLPYAPLQHALFALDPDMVLVMTSGNYSEEPIVYREGDAFRRLGGIADLIAAYNRDILGQSDDSVFFVVGERPFFVRRARGFVPLPFRSSNTERTIMALGGDLKNCFGIARRDFIILSQHLGDMADPRTFTTFKQTVDHFIRIFDAVPDLLVADLHPGYVTTQYAEEMAAGMGSEPLKIQHHHAHIASVMEDLDLEGAVLGVAFDGTGYGPDGTLWGSEIMVAGRGGYRREAHFSYFPLPGGENAIRDVWKIGLSLVMTSGGDCMDLWPQRNAGPVGEIIARRINAPLTCSIGRLFDGVAAILGLSETISTEAEAAILLEEAAYRGSEPRSPFIVPTGGEEGTEVIDTTELVRHVLWQKEKGVPVGDIALAFHYSIVHTAIRILKDLRDKTGLHRVVASGGVFHNRIILDLFISEIEKSGLTLFLPRRVPFNDGCIALGQIAVSKVMKAQGDFTQHL
ncbi:MAG: carbamoyltransferase HypF [Spirochaetes bacterium]|nr:carbamoyltransferase HypF [Spirochaetota bacterium]